MTDTAHPSAGSNPPTLAEDLLLLLFQPESGTIAGETTLYYVLGAAVLAEMALRDDIAATTERIGTVTVAAVERDRPSDELFHSAWEYVSERPRAVQSILAAVGPTLRRPVLERLIARGDVREEKRKKLGLFTITTLIDGGTKRRADLMKNVRAVLVEGATPTPRVAALVALLWGSGALPQFHPEIPWNSAVIARAEELGRGNFGAAGANEAVTRTMTAIVINSVIVATTASGPQ
ncbi:GOLPH3/VPS74 family protein [Mycobacterium sp. Root265]|uniref:GOLPH3/VPS74 family protein n=1 Tax=Mycobacterium sp. Root265 TaxID=1736504 RepID=UPI000A7EB100|nr:GPP34 family phosphoprotein [Mycobacterium sp. Root265]